MVFHPTKLLLLYAMISPLLFLMPPCATQLLFNYSDFSGTNAKNIVLTGNATFLGPFIQLTPDAPDNWGRATYLETMRLWNEETEDLVSFTTTFSFIISSEGKANYSDGLTFFLASPGFPSPKPTDGAGLGLVSRIQLGDWKLLAQNKFVAVEFDTFRNDAWDPPAPVREHVGININSIRSQKSTAWYTKTKEDRTYSATISYDSSSQILNVTFTGFNSDNTPMQQHLSSRVNLRQTLPALVEFGFSSSTGLISELHVLCSWSFESGLQKSARPYKNEAEGSMRKLVAGLILAGCILINGLGSFVF